jgi:hypothetical protein
MIGNISMRERYDRYYIGNIGRPERKITLGKPKHRWKDYIKSGLKEMESEAVNLLNWLRINTNSGNFRTL